MRNVLITLAVVILVFLVGSSVALSQSTTPTGNLYLQGSDYWRLGYALGFMNGFGLGVSAPSTAAGADLLKCLMPMTAGQVRAIVDKYLADHPEKWHESLVVLTVGALNQACPPQSR